MDDKTRIELADINVELKNAWSAAFALTEALSYSGADAGAFAGAMSLLTDVISHVEENIATLIESVKH